MILIVMILSRREAVSTSVRVAVTSCNQLAVVNEGWEATGGSEAARGGLLEESSAFLHH